MPYPSHCPHCTVCLDSEDILKAMMKAYPDDEKRALDAADCYGWTPENKMKFTRLLGIYDLEQDRTVYYYCPDCSKRIDR